MVQSSSNPRNVDIEAGEDDIFTQSPHETNGGTAGMNGGMQG